MSITAKLAEVMGEVGYVQKDARNDFHKYRYASAEAVLKKVNQALSTRGIAVSSSAVLERYEAGASRDDASRAIVRLALTFHDGDESLTVEGIGEGSDKGDKSTMKANTAALKYAMANAFLISWGDDPEADAQTDIEADKPRRADRNSAKNGIQESARAVFGEALDLPAEYVEFARLCDLHKGTRGINDLRMVGKRASDAKWPESKLLRWIRDQKVDLENGAKTSDFARLRFEIEREVQA